MQIEEAWGVRLRGRVPCYVPALPELPLRKTLEQSRRGAQAWLCCKLPGGTMDLFPVLLRRSWPAPWDGCPLGIASSLELTPIPAWPS